MIRILNFFALVAMLASAIWAYSVKYETILVAEKLKKRNAELRHERDAVAVLEAEWQLLNRPARLATLAKPGEGMAQMSARQVAQPRDIPLLLPKVDALDTLVTGSLFAVPKTPEPVPSAQAGARGDSRKAPAQYEVKAKSEVKARAGHGAPLPLQNSGAIAARASAANSKAPAASRGSVNTGAAAAGNPATKNAPVKNASAKPVAPQNTSTKRSPARAAPDSPAKAAPPASASPRSDSAVLGALVKKILN